MLNLHRYISARWALVGVLLVAAALRLHGLETQSFWNDEGNTLRLIQRRLPDLIRATAQDIHPPGYYVLLRFWATFVGEHEFGLRSFSAFWGVLAVAFSAALGRALYVARGAGVVAALLVALNAFAVYYSQEARMYAQLAALSAASLWLLVRLMSKPRPSFWLALALVNALGLYTQYTYPFTLLVQGGFFVWAWWGKKERRIMGAYLAANVFTLILFAPWLPTAHRQLTAWGVAYLDVPLPEKLQTIFTYITYGNTAQGGAVAGWLWWGVLLAASLLPDWYKKPPSNRWRVLLPLGWVGVIVGALLFSGAYREANLKFLLPAQIGMALLVGRNVYLLWDVGSGSMAVPLETLPRWVAGVALCGLVVNSYGWLGMLYTSPSYQRHDYRAIAQEIARQSNAATAVILNAPGQVEVYSYYHTTDVPLYPLPRGLGGDDAATQAETRAIINAYTRIFVVFWGEGERDPRSIVKNTLDTHAYEVFSRWYGDVRLVRYDVLAPPPSQPSHTLTARFGDHITLGGYALTGDFWGGNVLGVTLFWQTDAPLPTRYKVFVQILNPDGTLAAQHDSEPANNRAPTTDWQPDTTIIDNHGVSLPPDLAPGTYTIIVGIYELDRPQNRLKVGENDALILETLP